VQGEGKVTIKSVGWIGDGGSAKGEYLIRDLIKIVSRARSSPRGEESSEGEQSI